jgi:hypothetical protein
MSLSKKKCPDWFIPRLKVSFIVSNKLNTYANLSYGSEIIQKTTA